MMDLDKENLENLLDNPFVAAIYKRTEPYMGEFLKLDPIIDLAEVIYIYKFIYIYSYAYFYDGIYMFMYIRIYNTIELCMGKFY
jgi:hypothetical protein